jgi:gamma-glutamylcysteine synthetase
MSEKLTKDQLIATRVEVENEANEKQVQLAEKLYAVEFEEVANITSVLKQIDKSYEWTIKNAAYLISLYDNLKANKVAITKSGDTATVELNSLDLNTLYQVLTNINGTGIESARTFTRLLTNVGKQITDAMQSMAADNKEIQEIHVQLAELDAAIEELSKETLEADEIS